MKRRGDQPATKGDLGRFATKDDLKQFATKDGLNRMRRDLTIEITRNRAEIRKIRKTMATKSDIQRILDRIEAASKSLTYVPEEWMIESFESRPPS
ncbi:MAG TPA: hypothetical protein VH309_01120 [Elusimicrobiota bacterium]|nr:hypothetical protein [Elusimicrobiota bacterium]